VTQTLPDNSSKDQAKVKPRETPAVAFFLLSMIFALLTGAALYVSSSPQLRKIARFEGTVRAILAEYPEDIDADEFFKNSSDAIYGTLDKYSHYAPAQSYSQTVEEYSGAYAGLGVSIVSQSQGLLIASVNPDGPAKEAGIKLGDVIISADSISLVGKTTQQASRILRGKAGDTVTVGLTRPRTQTTLARNRKGDLSFAVIYDTTYTPIVRASVPLRHVTLFGATPNGALYIKLNDFGAGAFEQFQTALDSLQESYPENHGIIIDLRYNPGGLLAEALKLADYFLPDNTLLLGEKGKSRWSRREFHGWSSDQTDGATIVIMINRFSASAAEVFSGALKYAGRATLVGDTTFGKGLIQEYNSLPDGSASKLTVGRYYFTGEHYLNQPGAEKVDSGSGLAPDVYHQFDTDGSLMQALGRRMLFTKFVARYQDRIIDAYRSKNYTDIISEFQQTVSETGFDYRSELLQRANALYLVSSLYESNEQSRSISDRIRRKTEKLEDNAFDSQQEQIIQRLAQLAFERRDDAKAAFLNVTLPNDPDILTCEKILLNINSQEGNSAESDTTRVGA
jgi:carboxyl-terminal processing protease